jgi:hypothetical protein
LDQGVRLQLRVGATVLRPASQEIVDSITSIQVTNNDRERDGFQMTLNLEKGSSEEYALIKSGALHPPTRVHITVIMGAVSWPLIDGVITRYQMLPGDQAGRSTLQVTGEDISLKLDLIEKNDVYRNVCDSNIVEEILKHYATWGIEPKIETTSEVPNEIQRVTIQNGTDLAFIRQLASRNRFIFYVEPGEDPGFSKAYWGQEKRSGKPQPAMTMNMGPYSNVEAPLNFDFNSLDPVEPEVRFIDYANYQTISVPPLTTSLPPLAAQSATPMRRSIARDSARLNLPRARLRSETLSQRSASAVNATGEVDTARYGSVLRPRRLVGVRGAGEKHDGLYYVKQVTHRIRPGEYKQSFTLEREGLGSSVRVVS